MKLENDSRRKYPSPIDPSATSHCTEYGFKNRLCESSRVTSRLSGQLVFSQGWPLETALTVGLTSGIQCAGKRSMGKSCFTWPPLSLYFLDVKTVLLIRHDLEKLSPDFQAMMSAHSGGLVRGVIVTLQGNESNGCVDNNGAVYDFVSRYFAPWVGIPEDPVTG